MRASGTGSSATASRAEWPSTTCSATTTGSIPSQPRSVAASWSARPHPSEHRRFVRSGRRGATRRYRAAALGADHVVHGGKAHDLVACDLPRLLHDPRERPILPVRLLLDFPQHVLGEVEALLSLVSTRHQHPPGASAAA